MSTQSPRRRRWRFAFTGALLLVAAVASACGGESDAGDPNAPILVWTDSTRQPAFEAFQKAHPETELEIEVVDPTAMLSKIQLANRVGEGWPDVIFAYPSDVAAMAGPLFKYAQPLEDLVPAEVQKGFATDSAACTIDGKLYCLQNDIAQSVLWYNAPQMKKFGYEVPTTWQEYQDLGKEVAAEHPGYLIGAAGGVNIYYDYLWSSGCPLQKVINSTQVEINTEDEKCTRVAEMIDPLLENGSVSRLSPFDPEINKLAKDGKLLMIPAASWFAEFAMKPDTGYSMADGQVAAAPMPLWEGESVNYSGAQGGGVYVVSRHAANLEGAVEVAQWVATSEVYQTTAPTYPAYKPAAQAWLAKVKTDEFYAEDPSEVLVDAASKINPAVGPTRYPIDATVNATLVAAITSGETVASAFEELQTQLAALAATSGYEVTQ